MHASDPGVTIEETAHGTVRARHPELADTWAEGPDRAAALAALDSAITVSTGVLVVGPEDPITLRYDHDGGLDEIVTTRAIHLERMSDTGFYLGVGSLQVWLDVDSAGRLVATYASNTEAVVVQPSFSA